MFHFLGNERNHGSMFGNKSPNQQNTQNFWLNFWNLHYKYSLRVDILQSHKLCLKLFVWLGLPWFVLPFPTWILQCLIRSYIAVFSSPVGVSLSDTDFPMSDLQYLVTPVPSVKFGWNGPKNWKVGRLGWGGRETDIKIQNFTYTLNTVLFFFRVYVSYVLEKRFRALMLNSD